MTWIEQARRIIELEVEELGRLSGRIGESFNPCRRDDARLP